MYTLFQHWQVLLLRDKHVHFIAASAGLTVKKINMYTLFQHRLVLLLRDKHVHFIAASVGLTVKR